MTLELHPGSSEGEEGGGRAAGGGFPGERGPGAGWQGPTPASCGERGTRSAWRQESEDLDVQGYPGWELCLQCTEEAGRGLILLIISKEPLADKKLKQKDYLGSTIFPILQPLQKTRSAKPGNAGT